MCPHMNHLLFCLLLPSYRILTRYAQFPALSTNRSIATALRLARSARFTGARDSTAIARGNTRSRTRDGDFSGARRIGPTIRAEFSKFQGRGGIGDRCRSGYRDGCIVVDRFSWEFFLGGESLDRLIRNLVVRRHCCGVLKGDFRNRERMEGDPDTADMRC